MQAGPREPKRAPVTLAFRPLLWLLLVAALFVRAFVPQGYMPERTAGSTISVAICDSGGHWTIPLDEDGGAPEEDRRADPPCAFAGLGTPALPPIPPVDIPEFVADRVSYGVASAAFESPDASAHLPPVRGPPVPA